MSLVVDRPQFDRAERTEARTFDAAPTLVDDLQHWFGVEFSIWNGETGTLLYASRTQPTGDEAIRGELIRSLDGHGGPEFIGDSDHVLILALPVGTQGEKRAVAIAAFVTRYVDDGEDLEDTARLLDLDQSQTAEWVNSQPLWTAESLKRLAASVLGNVHAEQRMKRLLHEMDTVANNLTTTYEEISLLHGLTQNLRISATDEQLGKLAIDWLMECLPAKGVAIQYLPVAEEGNSTYEARTQATLLTGGNCPLRCEDVSHLVRWLEPTRRGTLLIANESATSSDDWPFPQIRQLILVPLSEGDHIFGWLLALNHSSGEGFGSIEASLLSSVGAILGIHCGNLELYRQQREFLADVVRALTSAIDAKDPYTCGHSDRVARIAMRLGQELDCDPETINTLYMAGLLHDIGKIGIEDSVLRKTGHLNQAEFEHIKLHPELGYKILADLKQLKDVLPVVLHHHEQWDGNGYPHGLEGENIPLSARIAAVADAWDAMSSDRPYRKGMPIEKVAEIFRSGAGKQWDASVIEAFFRAFDDIREISRRERERLDVEALQLT